MASENFTTNIPGIIEAFPEVSWMTNEVVLNLTTAVIKTDSGQNSINDCLSYLKLNNVPFTNAELLLETIPINEFDSLYSSLANICTPGTEIMLGLRIYYGIKSGALHPVFEPVAYKNGGQSGNTMTMNLSNLSVGFFEYDGSSMSAVSGSKKETYVTAYKNTIKIQRVPGSGVFDSFQNGIDVECVMMPFQTIYQLALDNNNQVNLQIYNAIKIESIAKCSVLMYMGSTPTASSNSFKGNYANRGTKCPDECLTYTEPIA